MDTGITAGKSSQAHETPHLRPIWAQTSEQQPLKQCKSGCVHAARKH